MIKYLPLIFAAVFIDGLQALLTFGLTTIGSVVPLVGNALGLGLSLVVNVCISFTFGTFLVLTLVYLGMYYPSRLGSGALFEIIPGLDALPGWTIMTISCVLKKTAAEGESFGSGVLGRVLSPQNSTAAIVGKISGVSQTVPTVTQGGVVRAKESSGSASSERVAPTLKSVDGLTRKPIGSSAQNMVGTNANDNVLLQQKYAA